MEETICEKNVLLSLEEKAEGVIDGETSVGISFSQI